MQDTSLRSAPLAGARMVSPGGNSHAPAGRERVSRLDGRPFAPPAASGLRKEGQVPESGDAPVLVLANRAAGWRQEARLRMLAAALAQHGPAAELRPVAPGELRAEIRRALRAGSAVLGVAGGDGSHSAAAAELVGTGMVLVPVPLGTLNHFSRRVGVPDVETAARALAAARNGSTGRIAVGVVNDRIFLNTVTCGLYAHVVRKRERLRPFVGKWPAALWAALEVTWGLGTMEAAVAGEERAFRGRTPLVWVGMGRGSFPFTSEAAARPRVMEVLVARTRNRVRWVKLGLETGLGLARGMRPRPGRRVAVFHSHAFELYSRAPLVDVTLDGEVLRLEPPLRFSIWENALCIAAPLAHAAPGGTGGGDDGSGP
jgi:diacylglycerol kinase family enzyme